MRSLRRVDIIKVSVTVLLLLVAYLYYDTVAYIDGYRITRRHVKWRNQIVKIYEPTETRDLGLQQLIRARVRLALLKKLGLDLNKNDLLADAERIKNQTQAAQKLESIREIFNGNESAYLEVFVLPALVEQKIYSFANYGNKNFHINSFNATADFIKNLKTSQGQSDFKEFATQAGAEWRELTLSTRRGLQWYNPGQRYKLGIKPPFENPARAQKLFEENLKELKKGEVVSEPIDFDDVWLVPMIVNIENIKSKNDTVVKMNVAIFKKMDVIQWVESEAAKVKVILL